MFRYSSFAKLVKIASISDDFHINSAIIMAIFPIFIEIISKMYYY